MVIRRIPAKVNVVEAAYQRIRNIFANGFHVYMGFSGGKDTACMAYITYDLIKRGEIDPKQLTCTFIDEEAIFPCVEKFVKEWRQRFLDVGANFEWYCIEVKHFNCFNELEQDESFICFDRYKKDVWIRQPPKFAIRTHPQLRPRRDTYQEFLDRIHYDGITMLGTRVAESVQRLYAFGKTHHHRQKGIFKPIYDWTDDDVWRFLYHNNIDIPEAYLYLYQIGVNRKFLRISQFFSIDTAKNLVQLQQFYPDLMERIERREPNSYLAALYWDSAMFGRNSATRKELEDGQQEKIDYKKLTLELIEDIENNFSDWNNKKTLAKRLRAFMLTYSHYMTNRNWRSAYEMLGTGDPKMRSFRAFATTVLQNKGGKDQAERRMRRL